jgi:molybdopterin-guanine dinucleotide biosynthesis protein A
MQQAIHALILAGGQSTRMGTDKALLPINGKPLLYRLASQSAAFAQTVTIAIGSPQRESLYREALVDLAPQVKFVADQFPGCGPLSGLHAGLSAIADGYVFVIACDMPQVSVSLLQLLLGGIDSGADVIHTAGQPFHALYHTRIAAQIQASLEAQDYRLMGLLNRLHTIELAPREEEQSTAFTNLNTPEDYSKYTAE